MGLELRLGLGVRVYLAQRVLQLELLRVARLGLGAELGAQRLHRPLQLDLQGRGRGRIRLGLRLGLPAAARPAAP